ncbi:MAG: murein biosynthesis integral membrane protein MurJ [Candidatus Bipolaricaulia bacterium]
MSDKGKRAVRGFLGHALVMAGATLVSRLFGLARDVIIADRFGAGAAYDAYIIAFFVPHMLRRLLAEGTLSTAMVPIFIEYLTKRGKRAADEFASNLFNLILLIFPVLVVAGVLLAPYYIPFLADGFRDRPEQMTLTINLTRVMFPFIALVGIAALFMGILNSYDHFFAPAFAPVLFNLGVIGGALYIGSLFGKPIYGLAVGVLVGGAGQLLIQVPFLRRRGFVYRSVLNPNHEGIRRMFRMILPIMIGLAVVQINILVDNKLASRLEPGGISALQYAIRLFQLPLGVFAVAISNAILPRLSRHTANEDRAGFVTTLRTGIELTTFVILPATAGLYAIGKPTIRLLFEHGLFGPQATTRTLLALNYYLIGLIGYSLVYLLTRAFYAFKDTRIPALIGGGAVIINIILDYALIGPLREGGLALATAISGLFNMAGLYLLLQRRLGVRLISFRIVQIFWASIVMGLTVYGVGRWLSGFVPSEWVLVLLPLTLGVGVYLALARLSGFLNVIREAF